VLTTNRDVSTIPRDLTKRMVTCHTDAATPENRSVTERIARRTQKEIGTALYRAYLQRLIPEVSPCARISTRRQRPFPICWHAPRRSCETCLVKRLTRCRMGTPLSFTDYFGIRHRRFRDQLSDMLADAEDRIAINRRAGELTISFSGDTNQAGQFARSVPDFVLKGRFADQVKLDLHALEQEMGFAVERSRAWWQRILKR
jgi:hypothetical protein